MPASQLSVRGIILAVCVTALGLAGCTTPDAEPPPSTTRSTPDRPAAPRPKDRDADAVLAALRELDLCALLDKANAATPSVPDGVRPRTSEPFACSLDLGEGGIVSVTAFSFGHQTRIASSTRTISGAKAYLRQGGNCYVDLPVSFTTALEFSQGPAAGCGAVTNLATAAANVLANPDAVRAKPVWDACTALAGTLDTAAGEAKLVGNGPVDCTNWAAEPTPVGISFADGSGPPAGSRAAKINGVRVSVDESDKTCDVYWRQRPFDSRYAATPDHQVVTSSTDCDRSSALAEKLMGVLEKAPPTDTAPQRPLLYRPDEPDSPYPGACAYVDDLDPKRCEPYVEVAVPDDPAEILRAVTADANGQCELSAKAVGARFGIGLVPVAESDSGTRCFFVEPQRRLQLTFSMSYGEATNEGDGKAVTVAGHPGYVSSDPDSFRYELSTTTEARGDTLTLVVAAGPATDAAPPKDADGKARSALADVVRAYFS